MKIVDTDNHGGDYPNEKFVAENIKHKEFAETMCRALNDRYCSHDSAPRYYKVVEDDYKLQPGFVP